MLFVTDYTFRPNMAKACIGRLLALFGQLGPEPGTIARYAKDHGSGGLVINVPDDPLKV